MKNQFITSRLLSSTALSLLIHLLVFFSINIFIQFHLANIKEKKIGQLEVRLAKPIPPKPQYQPKIKLLTTKTPTKFKLAQNLPVVIPPPASNTDPETDTIQGVGLLSAVETPFPGQARTNTPFSLHEQSAQQQAARTYYQQVMEAQARQRSEIQAQLMMQQLQQLLDKRLEEHPLVTGKCVLVEASGSANNKLKCDSSALYEAFYKDQQSVAGMLIALRGMGRIFNGFTIEAGQNTPIISFVNNLLIE